MLSKVGGKPSVPDSAKAAHQPKAPIVWSGDSDTPGTELQILVIYDRTGPGKLMLAFYNGMLL